jgi:CubicO group peptidase (beta-lactamase class C family)
MRSVAFTLALSLSLAGCAGRYAPARAAPPIIAPVDAGALAATRPDVERLLAAEVERLHLPSLAFGLVTRSGLVYFVGLGARDEGGAPVTAETVFRIGSITKTFTGVALLELRDAGKLDLDDPVAKYLPELAEARHRTADSAPIRIRHLVTHTSGLPRLGKLDYAHAEVTRADLRDAARSAVLEFEPGTKSVYSNLAMALAGPIVARASGEPYRAYMQAHIFAPLGMTHTVWDRDDVPPELLAQGWAQEKGSAGFTTVGAHWRLGAAEAMGGLYSNVADMSRYVAFELSAWPPRDEADGGPLRRSSVRESQVLAGNSLPGKEGFGVNWIVRSEPHLGHVVFHNGATEGYHSAVWMLPARGVGVVVLGPATFDIDGIGFRALTAVVAAEHGPAERGVQPPVR